MRNLIDIDETHSIYPLNADNYINYDSVYKLMKGVMYHKLNDVTLWNGYDQGWNLVESNLLDCDGFDVLYDILSEILPKLNINSARSTTIQWPVYTGMEDDNIYSYVNQYNTFLRFEKLCTNPRLYNPYEIAVNITTDLDSDSYHRFDKGVNHVRMQLKLSSDGNNVPKDICISKTAKTICKYGPEYRIDEYDATS